MKGKEKPYSLASASLTMILFFILVSSTALASTVQNYLPIGPYAYVTNWDSNISVIDTTINSVTKTVDLSIRYCPGEIAVTSGNPPKIQ